MNRFVGAALTVAAAGIGGCADVSRPAATTAVDSVGIRVVTNLAGSIKAADSWTLPADPATEIGSGVSPDDPLYQVAAVQPLAGGRVAVGTSTPPRVLIFDRRGSLTATLGRGGDGPGEFDSVGSVTPAGGDSLAIWDPGRRRISIFTASGIFVREVNVAELVSLSPLAAPSTRVPAAFTSLLPAGSGAFVLFSVAVWGPGVPESGTYRLELPSHLITSSGEPLATFGPFAGMELYKSDVGEMPFPFGASTHGAMLGSSLVVGTADETELRLFAPDGSLKQIIRWRDQDRTLAGSAHHSDFERWLEGQLAGRDPAEQTMLREIIGSIPDPERYPAYDALVGTDTDEIWIGEYAGQLGLMGFSPESRPVPARRWLIFNSDGTLVATVATPQGFQPHAIRDGHVWGMFKDELEVESVRAYEVVKG